jgi:hypothetical protein
MARRTWTVDQDRQLVSLEQQGFSTSLIGVKMGKSRGAVIGRSHRLRGHKARSLVKARPRSAVTIRKNLVARKRSVGKGEG